MLSEIEAVHGSQYDTETDLELLFDSSLLNYSMNIDPNYMFLSLSYSSDYGDLNGRYGNIMGRADMLGMLRLLGLGSSCYVTSSDVAVVGGNSEPDRCDEPNQRIPVSYKQTHTDTSSDLEYELGADDCVLSITRDEYESRVLVEYEIVVGDQLISPEEGYAYTIENYRETELGSGHNSYVYTFEYVE